MTETNVTIAIFAVEEHAKVIRNEIALYPDCQSRLTRPRNLDGDTAAWIVIATLAAQALPHFLRGIKDHFAAKKVKRIKIGDWEVENPTPEMLERFIAMTDAKSKQERPKP